MADTAIGTAGRPDPGRWGERGTTLVEVLIVLALVSLITVPLMLALQNAARSERAIVGEIDAARSADSVGRLLEADIRAGSVDGGGPVGESTASVLVLEAIVNGAVQEIRWSVSGGQLQRQVTDLASGAVIVRSALAVVSSDESGFTYFNTDGSPIDPVSNAGCVSLVEVRLVIEDGDAEVSRAIAVASRASGSARGGGSC
jgi:hypothetical protein